MEGGRRSFEHSDIVLKKRNSSGCLIVKKKGDGVGRLGSYSGRRPVSDSRKEKKRSRVVTSDSGSSDELLIPPRGRPRPETIRVCNALVDYEGESELGRQQDRMEHVRYNEDGFVERNINRLDVFEFDEYDGTGHEMGRRRMEELNNGALDAGGNRFLGSNREYKTGSSREAVVERRRKAYLEKMATPSFENHAYKNRLKKSREESEVPGSLSREKYIGGSDSDGAIRVQGKNGVLKVMINKNKKIGASMRSFDDLETKKNNSSLKVEETVKRRRVTLQPLNKPETEVLQTPGPSLRKQKSKLSKSPSSKKQELESSEDSDASMQSRKKFVEAHKSAKKVSSKREKLPSQQPPPARSKEGKVKRGSGTEKQRLREHIRVMLLDAGWKIDYRPRKNRDYLDAVYINPTGTAYWSIIKAYEALLKQLNDDTDEGQPKKDDSAFAPISDKVLSQLTRKTGKKTGDEMKKKQRVKAGCESDDEIVPRKHATTSRHAEESDSYEEKLSSFLKPYSKSVKSAVNEKRSLVNAKSRSQSSLRGVGSSSASSSLQLHGRKSKKFGRCTLLVRGSKEGQISGTDCFVPYSGKRTLLSWLIDSGTVQLSQKVQYMNRRQTRVMLEGWITRDGIHCCCCSKILTVSRFEIHAGSKLRQPFQNIYLDCETSLLQCLIDAWDRQKDSERIGFHSVSVEGDDPNDDTCGICGDGGDLICCDGCPSTFHLSCLSIEMLPPGDWHCTNCICKFCGAAAMDIAHAGDVRMCTLLTCSLCEKKYHKSCGLEMDAPPTDGAGSPSFCGPKCQELFEQLQKFLGIKNELEAGFSWSLIRRVDADLDSHSRILPQWAESQSKLAVALTVMDECFLPIVDRRSGIDMIRNVLYNCGSNFNRMNYSGFYTAILERGDEIISAASLRFHGTQLAEMPFIGTRHIYRRQGMCRRLFSAIQSALCSFKVEKMILPAIAEFMNAWTKVFGFTPLEDSLQKELRSMNLLVFPGIDMLQKQVLEQERVNDTADNSGAAETETKVDHSIISEVPIKHDDIDSSPEHERNANPVKNENDEFEEESLSLISSADHEIINCSVDVSQELQPPTRSDDYGTVTKTAKSAERNCVISLESNLNSIDTENNSGRVYPEDFSGSRTEDVVDKVEIPEGTVCASSHSPLGHELHKSSPELKYHTAMVLEDKPISCSPVKKDSTTCEMFCSVQKPQGTDFQLVNEIYEAGMKVNSLIGRDSKLVNKIQKSASDVNTLIGTDSQVVQEMHKTASDVNIFIRTDTHLENEMQESASDVNSLIQTGAQVVNVIHKSASYVNFLINSDMSHEGDMHDLQNSEVVNKIGHNSISTDELTECILEKESQPDLGTSYILPETEIETVLDPDKNKNSHLSESEGKLLKSTSHGKHDDGTLSHKETIASSGITNIDDTLSHKETIASSGITNIDDTLSLKEILASSGITSKENKGEELNPTPSFSSPA